MDMMYVYCLDLFRWVGVVIIDIKWKNKTSGDCMYVTHTDATYGLTFSDLRSSCECPVVSCSSWMASCWLMQLPAWCSLISPDNKRLGSTPHFTLDSANRQRDRLTGRGCRHPGCKHCINHIGIGSFCWTASPPPSSSCPFTSDHADSTYNPVH